MAPRISEKSFAAAVALLAASVGIDASYVTADSSAFGTLDKNLAGKMPSKHLKLGSEKLPGSSYKQPACPPNCIVSEGLTPSAQGKVESGLRGEQGKVEFKYKEDRLPSEQFKVEINGVHGDAQPSGI